MSESKKPPKIRITESNKKTETEQPEPTQSDLNPYVALVFINSYIDNLNQRRERIEIREWTKSSELVSQAFKAQLVEIITEAWEQDSIYGLGFDPILNAQDYPDEGFELSSFDKATGMVALKGKKAGFFKLNLKLITENGQTLVNGCGVVNIPE